MNIPRFTDTPDGGSRFVDTDVRFEEIYVDRLGTEHPRSRTFDSTGRIVELAAGSSMDWHGAPARRVIVVLDGTLEVETTDGEVRRFGRGDVVIADDTEGQGHRTRVVGAAARVLFLDVAPGTPADVFGS